MWINLSREELEFLAQRIGGALEGHAASIESKIEMALASDDADDAKWVAAARELHGDEGTLEVDEGALVSRGDDPGAYVMAWVWVTNENVGLAACEDCGDYHPVEKLIDGFCDNCADPEDGDDPDV